MDTKTRPTARHRTGRTVAGMIGAGIVVLAAAINGAGPGALDAGPTVNAVIATAETGDACVARDGTVVCSPGYGTPYTYDPTETP